MKFIKPRAFLSTTAIVLAIPIALAIPAAPALAVEFPAKPVKIVVTYPPGGGMDVMARVLAVPLGERLGKTVIVENRPGASGMIGAEYVARSEPDGYTLIIAPADTHSINPHVYSHIRYDARRDFSPVALLGNLPMTLVVNPGLPVKSVDDFKKLAKDRPGKISYASWGIGSSSHVAMETLMLDAKLDMLHVPFTGAAQAITAVISGNVDSMMVTLPTAEPFHQSGKVRIVGVTPIQRAAGMPTYPQEGMPSQVAAWIGILAPAKTPPEVLERLNREIKAVMQDGQIREKLVKAGLEPVDQVGSPSSFERYLAVQYELWGKTVKEAKISVDLK